MNEKGEGTRFFLSHNAITQTTAQTFTLSINKK